ncbi:MAG TPA: hypothetical protein VMU00_00730 [Steroidobacteraceae bacterium]|nr:hypothetical protein [Steroidobacteraceae bacterium]
MRVPVLLSLAAAGAILCGCVAAPPPHPPPPVEHVAPPPEQVTEVVAYPSQGQSPEQLDRDRYECHNWAVKQTGFDPSVPGVPPHQRVVVRGPPPPPPGAGAATGAVTGAVLGAIIAGPYNGLAGAAVGAIAGGAVGVAADQQRAAAYQDAHDQAVERARVPGQEQRAGAYRRAIAACLEGRGYSVR